MNTELDQKWLDCTLKEFFYQVYFPYKQKRIRKTTAQGYNYLFKNRILPYLGNRKLRSITSIDIRMWQDQILDKKFSQSYAYKLNKCIGSVFKFAKNYYGLKTNPCSETENIGKNKTTNRMQIWSYEEYCQIFQSVDSLEMQTPLCVLFWSGIRRSELYGLQWKDYVPQEHMISIVRTYQRLHGRAEILLPKTDTSRRDIILPKVATEQLEKYKTCSKHTCPDDFIFTWSKKKLDDAIQSACDKTGIKIIRVHDIRHSHASLLIRLNMDVAAISKRLGHSSISVTLNTYAHAYTDADLRIARTLEKLT